MLSEFRQVIQLVPEFLHKQYALLSRELLRVYGGTMPPFSKQIGQ